MDKNKVITMKEWTSSDKEVEIRIEEGIAEIAIDNSEYSRVKTKFVAPNGSILQPKAEINNILQLCRNYEKCKNKAG